MNKIGKNKEKICKYISKIIHANNTNIKPKKRQQTRKSNQYLYILFIIIYYL